MTDTLAPKSKAQQLAKRNRELSILNTIAQALNREVNLDAALQSALTHVADLLDLHTGWIFLLNPQTGKPYLAATLNLPPALLQNPQLMSGSCYCLDTYQAGDLDGAANVNIITCSRLSKLVDGADGLRYHASIPLYAHGKELGVLNAVSANWRELSENDLQLLYTVGDLLSIAIERARLFAQSAELGAVEERNRLAREIHDTLAQGLTAVSLKLEAADALLENQPEAEQAQNMVSQALALTRANLEEARRSVLDLRAAPLEGRTLPEALQALTESIASRSGLSITFEGPQSGRPLSPRLEAGLYRIVQEALNNIIRHAQAAQVNISLNIDLKQISIIIEDDGQGFDPAHIPANSFGLIGINERAKLLGGAFEIQSSPNQGTRAEVVVPLNG